MRVFLAATLAAVVFAVNAFAAAEPDRASKKNTAPAAQVPPGQTKAADTPAQAASNAAAESPPAEIVTGFRSAKFGMSEADVRAAILKDFGVKSEAVKAQDNPAELTHSLLVTVPDLLTSGGIAEVSYVFGYKSKTLIQIGTVWSKTTDPGMTPEKLFSNANILRAHFLNGGFKPDTIAVNTPINGGLLMFRGSDARDRTVILLLQGTFENKNENQRVLTPSGLLLFYVADAKSPDVFKLPPGQF